MRARDAHAGRTTTATGREASGLKPGRSDSREEALARLNSSALAHWDCASGMAWPSPVEV